MNKKLRNIIKAHGDTQQEVAELLGLKSRISIYRKLHGKARWKQSQIDKICERYHETKEKLGL